MRVRLVTSPHLDHTAYHRRARWESRADHLRLAQTFAPMGLISLAESVPSTATVSIADINKAINSLSLPMSARFYDAAASWLLESEPDLLAFMTEADSYHHLLRITSAAKKRKPSLLTLLGGPHASAVHDETLLAFPSVDFVIRGEGELAFRSLIETLMTGGDLTEVGNLTHRVHGEVVANAQLPLIDDLDTLPFPSLSRIDLEPQDALFVEIGRGCPFRCNFCFTAPYWQRKHRIKSPGRILRELRYFRDHYGRTDFNFTHDLFTTNRRWVIDFCRQLSESDLEVTWTCSSRTDTIDEEQIYWMQRAGCRNIYFGVEAGSARMQATIDKNLDLSESREIIRKSTDCGIGVTVGFISGLPGETAASYSETLGEAFWYLALPGSIVHMFGYSPYKGSAVYTKIKDHLVFDDNFVDFPLPYDMHRRNCALMRKHLDLFSRYSWLDSTDGLDPTISSAAEEYFPMVNALRSLMLALSERGADPFDTLASWSSWIAAKNASADSTSVRLYQGTIEQFLEFLGEYLAEEDLLDPAVKEMIRWERVKNVLRSRTQNFSIPSMFTGDTVIEEGEALELDGVSREVKYGEDREVLLTNPSVLTESFALADLFLSGYDGSGPTTFGFYAKGDGTPAIVRLSPVAALMIDLAKAGIGREALLRGIAEYSNAGDPNLAKALEVLIDALERAELLVPVSSIPIRRAVPQGVQQRT